MNINELNIIKTINIEEAMNTKRGTGTFKEIIEKVYSDDIRPLVMNDGTVVGISYDSKTGNHADDNLEQIKFERRYSGKPLMEWVLESLKLKARNAKITELVEEGNNISVTLTDGEVVVISEDNSKSYDEHIDDEDLPEYIEIPYDEIEPLVCGRVDMQVKNWLREHYDHYLAKGCELSVRLDPAHEYIEVDNIQWGRKR